MKLRILTTFAAAVLCLSPAAGRADLSAYSQNFEALLAADPAALSGDGWLVYGNVFTPAFVYMYGYGPFPAPNGGAAFSAIDAGQGGVEQGAQQLSVYNDYNNVDHANGNWVESNVFHEQVIGAADAGRLWRFQFDAKIGNLIAPTTAVAFIKTLDPSNGYQLTNFITFDTSTLPTTWATYSLSLPVVGSLVGQLAQFGFASTATAYVSSGVFYDNISWSDQGSTSVGDEPRARGISLGSASPNPFFGSTRIDYSTAHAGAAEVSIFDVTGRRMATLFRGHLEPGAHAASWDGRREDGSQAPAGVYHCVLQTAAGHQSRSLVLTR